MGARNTRPDYHHAPTKARPLAMAAVCALLLVCTAVALPWGAAAEQASQPTLPAAGAHDAVGVVVQHDALAVEVEAQLERVLGDIQLRRQRAMVGQGDRARRRASGRGRGA